jgi:predicted esterase
MEIDTLSVSRTARYATLGTPDAARAVWFVLHGYGQLAEYFIRPFESMAEERFIVAPEALSRFYTEGMRGRVGASWMTSAAREHEIRDYVAYLDALATHLRPRWPADAEVHVLGFSQGTATACRWAALGDTTVDRLTLWAGGVPPDLDLDAHGELLRRLDLTLVIGTDDEYISEDQVAAEEARLDASDIPHRTIRFDGPHRIDAEVLARVSASHSS